MRTTLITTNSSSSIRFLCVLTGSWWISILTPASLLPAWRALLNGAGSSKTVSLATSGFPFHPYYRKLSIDSQILSQPPCFISTKTELFIKWNLVRHGTQLNKYICPGNTVIIDEFEDLVNHKASDSLTLIFRPDNHILDITLITSIAKDFKGSINARFMLPCFDRLASSFHTTRIERWQYAHMGRNDCMTLDEAIQEFEFDCKIRHLSPKTIENY